MEYRGPAPPHPLLQHPPSHAAMFFYPGEFINRPPTCSFKYWSHQWCYIVCSQSSDEISSDFWKLHLRILFYKYIFLLKNFIVGNVDNYIYTYPSHYIHWKEQIIQSFACKCAHYTTQILRCLKILSHLVFTFKTESDLHLLKFFGIFWPLIVWTFFCQEFYTSLMAVYAPTVKQLQGS